METEGAVDDDDDTQVPSDGLFSLQEKNNQQTNALLFSIIIYDRRQHFPPLGRQTTLKQPERIAGEDCTFIQTGCVSTEERQRNERTMYGKAVRVL